MRHICFSDDILGDILSAYCFPFLYYSFVCHHESGYLNDKSKQGHRLLIYMSLSLGRTMTAVSSYYTSTIKPASLWFIQ